MSIGRSEYKGEWLLVIGEWLLVIGDWGLVIVVFFVRPRARSMDWVEWSMSIGDKGVSTLQQRLQKSLGLTKPQGWE